MRRALTALAFAAAATLLAFGIARVGGPAVVALESSVRDGWTPALAPVSPALVIVARDAGSEASFGTGVWDRAVLARAVTGLARGGAAAIGLDVAPGQPGAPGRGGATSDALLAQAMAAAGNVVVAVGPTGPVGSLALPAKSAGHTQAAPDADGVVRRVSLGVRRGDRDVPALGLALAAVSSGAPVEQVAGRIPADREGRALLRWAPDLQVTPFSELWAEVERGDPERLQKLAEGKTVLVLTEPAGARRLTPIGPLSDAAIQAELLNATLTSAFLREAPAGMAPAVTLVLAFAAATVGLTLAWAGAVIGLAVLVFLYAAGLAISPGLGIVLPVVGPLLAIVVAGGAALGWSQAGESRRLRAVEGEVAGIREALVRQESTVEALEEDLEAARASVARSTGTERELLQAAEALRQQLADARAQEEQTRGRLVALERELRAADHGPAALGDAEQERLRQRCAELGIVTRDPVVLALFRDLEKAARASLPILIAGEPGTGKELFARAAHRLSPRAAGPFVAVNMAAIPPELFESELFGHVKGGFTGAVAERKGYFEQADRGTLFFDEIGELRADHQGKLLRALQDKTFHRVGAARPTAVDVRIVSAGNRDLARGVAEGWFREDLYFRLRGLVLRLPALRERRPDIAPLAVRFLDEAAAEAGRRVKLSEAAVEALERHDWPGNVRELQQCLRRAVALAEREVLTPEDLGLQPTAAAPPRVEADDDAAVLELLRRHGFDMQSTARALGVDRSTVTQRLKGLGFRALVECGGDRAKAALTLAGDPALTRTVELKLGEYHEHLLRSVEGFDSADAAIAACRRRFKNLPDRHFRFLEALVRRKF